MFIFVVMCFIGIEKNCVFAGNVDSSTFCVGCVVSYWYSMYVNVLMFGSVFVCIILNVLV